MGLENYPRDLETTAVPDSSRESSRAYNSSLIDVFFKTSELCDLSYRLRQGSSR